VAGLQRTELEARLPEIQPCCRPSAAPLLDLHVSDLLNAHIPSTSDYTSQYDVLLFHRLVDSGASDSPAAIRAAGKGGTAPPPTRCCSACAPSPSALRCTTSCC
jgi:hypothetical protein